VCSSDLPRKHAVSLEPARTVAEPEITPAVELTALPHRSRLAIIIDDGGEPPPDDPAIYVPSAVPGGRAPHAWLKDVKGDGRVSLYDKLGKGFTLLRLGNSSIDAAPLVTAAARRKVPISVLDVDEDVVRDLYGRDLVLIRPDQHVAWRGDLLPDDPDDIIARATGVI